MDAGSKSPWIGLPDDLVSVSGGATVMCKYSTHFVNYALGRLGACSEWRRSAFVRWTNMQKRQCTQKNQTITVHGNECNTFTRMPIHSFFFQKQRIGIRKNNVGQQKHKAIQHRQCPASGQSGCESRRIILTPYFRMQTFANSRPANLLFMNTVAFAGNTISLV